MGNLLKKLRVIGSYRCGCTYGPVTQKDRLEYCGVHGAEILNEYEMPFWPIVCTCDVLGNGEIVKSPSCALHGDADL